MKPSRLLLALLSGLIMGLLMPLQAVAQEEVEAVTMPPSFREWGEAIPPELSELLPEGLFSEKPEDSLKATTEMTDWRFLMNALLSAVGLRLDQVVRLLGVLLGLVLLAAVCGRLREGLGGTGGSLFGFCLRLTLYSAMALQTVGMAESVTLYFQRLMTLTEGMIPTMGALYALGGNVGQAAANGEVLLLFLSALEYVSGKVTLPVCALCMAFSLMDAFSLRGILSSLSRQIKRVYTSLLGLIMFLLSLALSTRSVLMGKTDSLGMKGVKYAVSRGIPMVGNAIAGTLSSVAVGVSALRGICGVAGLVLIALLLLPTLVDLLLNRTAIRLAATVASMLSCQGEAELLEEMASLYGYMAAAACICALVFVLSLTLLLHSGVAFGVSMG